MKTSLLLVAATVIGMGVLSSSPADTTPEDEVRAVFERFVTAQNAHDLNAVADLLHESPDFLWITRGSAIWGRAAALKRFEALYAGTWHLEPDTASLKVILRGDSAAQLYVPIVFTIGSADQPAQATRFLMNQFLVNTAGGWRIASILPVPVPSAQPSSER